MTDIWEQILRNLASKSLSSDRSISISLRDKSTLWFRATAHQDQTDPAWSSHKISQPDGLYWFAPVCSNGYGQLSGLKWHARRDYSKGADFSEATGAPLSTFRIHCGANFRCLRKIFLVKIRLPDTAELWLCPSISWRPLSLMKVWWNTEQFLH